MAQTFRNVNVNDAQSGLQAAAHNQGRPFREVHQIVTIRLKFRIQTEKSI